jgi:folate-binding protein YgfZ
MNSVTRTWNITRLPAVTFDLSDWTQIDLLGPGAPAYLHNFCTNDVQRLSPGQSCEAFVCDIKGKILGHVLICTIDGGLRVIAVPGSADLLLPHLHKYLLDAQVAIFDRTAEYGLVCLAGTEAASVLAAAGVPAAVTPGQCDTARTRQGPLLIAGWDLTVFPTALISGSRAAVASIWDGLPPDLVAMGAAELLKIMRIEAGFPWHGADITPDNLAQEAARTDRAINFAKGCYLGQEPIARLDALGHVNRELRGLVIQSEHALAGDAVVDGASEVGRLTSAAFSPPLGASVALAIIRSAQAKPGTNLKVRTRQGAAPATVYWPRLNPDETDGA